MQNPLLLANKILQRVLTQKTLTVAFQHALNDNIDKSTRALVKELCFGVSRWYFKLTAIADQLLERPLRNKDIDIYLLILIGLYQLIYMRTPDHAALSNTVETCSQLKKPWAKNLVNAVLRHFTREASNILATVEKDLTAYYAHPAWLLEQIKTDWPEHWQTILDANNQQAPLSLRIDLRQITREAYLMELTKHQLLGHPSPLNDCGINLETACDVNALPLFAEGIVSVQDIAAQFAAPLLDCQPGHRVLDACAAPGGKTLHLWQHYPTLNELVAIDHNEYRLQQLAENIKRTKAKISVHHADATKPTSWWDGELFDRILLDAPCSATGVIRRQPDIKLHRQPEQIPQLNAQQMLLLKKLWPLLKKSGKLLYVTCSLLSAENQLLLEKFIAEHSDAILVSCDIPHSIKQRIGEQLLPGVNHTDGFYFACLMKQ